MSFIKLYIVAAAIFGPVYLAYYAMIGSRVHTVVLGDVMLADLRIVPSVLLWLIYPIGLVCFAILPARSDGAVQTAVLRGAAFGALTYATYGLTNLATLRHWTFGVLLVDVAYGAVIAALTAGLTFVIVADWLARSGPPKQERR